MKAKYLAIIPVFAFAFALTAAPLFAGYDHHRRSSDDINVRSNNDANVTNDVDATSNTGDNDANRNRTSGRITTGAADSLADVSTTANENRTTVEVRRGTDDVDVSSRNRVTVGNDVEAISRTGNNDANNNGVSHHRSRRSSRTVGNGVIMTGNAVSTAVSATLLNSNITSVK